jgi:hypothetical protein
MEDKKQKQISSTIVRHWKNKFDRSIRILLESGVKSEELIEEIRIVEDEKNN